MPGSEQTDMQHSKFFGGFGFYCATGILYETAS